MADEISFLNNTISYLTSSSTQMLQELSSLIKNSQVLSAKEKELELYGLPEKKAAKEQIQSELLDFAQEYCHKQQLAFAVDDQDFVKVWQELTFAERKAIVQGLKEHKEEELAQILSERIVLFEDLISMPDFQIQKLLNLVNTTQFSIALKNDDFFTCTDNIEKIRERLFANMSKRAKLILQEDIEFMGPALRSDVLKTRRNIARIIQTIYSDIS